MVAIRTSRAAILRVSERAGIAIGEARGCGVAADADRRGVQIKSGFANGALGWGGACAAILVAAGRTGAVRQGIS